MLFETDVLEQEELLVEEITDTGSAYRLIVWNDDVNTFDWVIKSFIEICGHTVQQAEQCSLIVHFKGKATVKTGDLKTIRPMKEGLTDRGINATYEVVEV